MNTSHSPLRKGLAVLSGGLAFVGSASGAEIIIDGSFENTTAVSGTVKVGGLVNPAVGAGWSTFSTYLYSTQYTQNPPQNFGVGFLRPYPSGTYGVTRSSDNVQQRVDLISASSGLTAAKIDAGSGLFRMSAWFSSYLGQQDYSDLTLEFLDANGVPVGDPIPLGGTEFYQAIPQGPNGRYNDAREWVQDIETGTIPAGARTARVTIQSTSVGGGAPDGYVDVVSLDVTDSSLTVPALASAIPANNAVNVGPVVDIEVKLEDRVRAVDTASIQLFLDNVLVPHTMQHSDTNTFVRYSAGLLPARSQHTYKIIFGDNGAPSTKQTNEFSFTVADYLSLPAALRTPLGSEDTTKPGFNVNVYQVATLSGDPAPGQANSPSSVGFAESVLAGLVGPNIADLTGAAQTNRFEIPDVINWITSNGAPGNMPNDGPFPGIPGTEGGENSFVDDIRTYIRFPSAGYYEMGVNNDDFFRLTAGTNGVQTLRVSGATELIIPTVPLATNITQIQFGGALPTTPLSGTVIYATPTGDPETSCDFTGNTQLAGKIVLLDIGGTGCNTAAKALAAQQAGAIAVIGILSGDTGYPARSGDANDEVMIPVLIIAEAFGGAELKTRLAGATPVTATIQTDTNPRLGEWDGPKGFGAVDVNFGFAVPEAGVYPFRLVAGNESGPGSVEWYSILPDRTRVLINDTTNPNSLKAFRARSGGGATLSFNAPTYANGKITIAWQGTGTLEETTALGPTTSWSTSPSQANPQTIDTSGAMKFFRIRQ
jgi:hypothetical protein